MNPLMKIWSVIGLLFMAAIFATIPISPQVTQRGVEVSVDQAQAATYGRNRRVNRRLLRRGAALTPWAAALGRPWTYGRAGYAAPAGYYYYGAPSYYYGGYGSYGAYWGQPVGGGGGQAYQGGGYYGPPGYYSR